uniref:Uncharacterized protein n=1 Tax=Aegilops tauschii subsp. strangulata TaxID=200361 RepID=A0A453HDH6_AEGTS
GYVGDDEANAAAFDSEGWLKTGDLCYIDQDGFLFVVDRLKELIKYKAYQVCSYQLMNNVLLSCSTSNLARMVDGKLNTAGRARRAGACPAIVARNCRRCSHAVS